jgi:peroxiredoxin
MKKGMPPSVQWIGLMIVFVFLLSRLLLGCDKEAPRSGPWQLGDAAPDFAAKDLDGNVAVLSSLGNGPIILRFFESNCRFCKADTPIIAAFFRKYRDKGLKVLYIGSFYENEKSLRAFIAELTPEFPVILDQGAKLADLYDIRAYPQTIFLSPDKRFAGALLGGVGEAELNEILGKYLGP